MYDETLKQCVPDPNYQNPFRQDNQGGGQDDNTGTGLDPFNQAPQYVGGTGKDISGTGGKSLVPTEDSGIDYNIFNYGTYAPTRAQMNEFMLINYGLDKGWLSYDDEKDAYRKIQFQEQIDPNEREIMKNQWGLNLLSHDAYRNYKDYFELLEKGYQPSSNQNVWKNWIQGDAQYSLTGGMIFREMSTRGGKSNAPVTYVNFSEDRIIYEEDEFGNKRQKFIKGFKTKIKEAMSIKDAQGNIKGIIDRDGNVNVRADEQGGYYDSKGNYTGGDGSKGSSLLKGMQYLINLKNSGIKLPDNLKQRLFKGINSKALTSAQKTTYASQLGYSSWNDAKKDLDTAVSNDNWWKKDEVEVVKPEVKKDDVTAVKDVGQEVKQDVDLKDDGSFGESVDVDQGFTAGTPSDDSYTFPVTEGPNPSDAGGTTTYSSGYKPPQSDTSAPNYPGNVNIPAPPSNVGTSVHGGGGMGSTVISEPKTPRCFHPEQLIGNKFIKDLEPGDLINGAKILGMVKLKLDEDMYSLNDVRVTGTHKVKYNNNWMYVSEHPDSFVINDKPEFVYVPIVEGGTFIINNYEFADYDDEHIETLNNKLKVA